MSLMSQAIQGLPPLPKSLSGLLNFNRESLSREVNLRSNSQSATTASTTVGAKLNGYSGSQPKPSNIPKPPSYNQTMSQLGQQQQQFTGHRANSQPPNSANRSLDHIQHNQHQYMSQLPLSKTRLTSSSSQGSSPNPGFKSHQAATGRRGKSQSLGRNVNPPFYPSTQMRQEQSSNSGSSASNPGSPSSGSDVTSPVWDQRDLPAWPSALSNKKQFSSNVNKPNLSRPGSLDCNLAILRKDMVSLRQVDMELLCQLMTLNDEIQTLKKNIPNTKNNNKNNTNNNNNRMMNAFKGPRGRIDENEEEEEKLVQFSDDDSDNYYTQPHGPVVAFQNDKQLTPKVQQKQRFPPASPVYSNIPRLAGKKPATTGLNISSKLYHRQLPKVPTATTTTSQVLSKQMSSESSSSNSSSSSS